MRTLLTTAMVLLLGASSSVSALGPHPVSIETADGITLQGWYIHPGSVPHDEVHEADTELFSAYPAVVLLHMYRGNKEDWVPILGNFYNRDIAALAIDMRGHGESTVGLDGDDLAVRVRNRDEALFNSTWQDAAAAVDWLEARGHRRDRIGLLGASVGCSVAIDAARRDPALRVVGAISPGANYLGVDTLKHRSNWGDRSLLIVSSEEEWPGGAKQIKDRLTADGEKDETAGSLDQWLLKDTGREVHGTRVLGRVDGIEDRLVDWFNLKLSPPVAPEPEGKPEG
jgi:pimeloyl-ACP methyl ester carboxylesterase